MTAIRRYLPRLALAAVIVLLLAMAASVQAQGFGARLGTIKRGGRVTYKPTGPGVLFDALGTYTAAFLATAVILLAAAVCTALIEDPIGDAYRRIRRPA